MTSTKPLPDSVSSPCRCRVLLYRLPLCVEDVIAAEDVDMTVHEDFDGFVGHIDIVNIRRKIAVVSLSAQEIYGKRQCTGFYPLCFALHCDSMVFVRTFLA